MHGLLLFVLVITHKYYSQEEYPGQSGLCEKASALRRAAVKDSEASLLRIRISTLFTWRRKKSKMKNLL